MPHTFRTGCNDPRLFLCSLFPHMACSMVLSNLSAPKFPSRDNDGRAPLDLHQVRGPSHSCYSCDGEYSGLGRSKNVRPTSESGNGCTRCAACETCYAELSKLRSWCTLRVRCWCNRSCVVGLLFPTGRIVTRQAPVEVSDRFWKTGFYCGYVIAKTCRYSIMWKI